MTDIRERLLTANPWKLMITLSLPAILGQFVVGFYALIDSIFVGQGHLASNFLFPVLRLSEHRKFFPIGPHTPYTD